MTEHSKSNLGGINQFLNTFKPQMVCEMAVNAKVKNQERSEENQF